MQLIETIARETYPIGDMRVQADDYYSSIDAQAADDDLKGQLQTLVSKKTVLSYDGAWKAFAKVDKHLPGYPCSPDDPDMIPDIYSSFCWKPEHNVPAPGRGECGNYKKEGGCFNREHSWPKSWFGGFSAGHGAQTDLFELWPSDGYVNNLRGNLPLGYVKEGTVSYTSSNGCKIGKCKTDESAGNCFEVADNLKGDLARTYFYLSMAYWKTWSCCTGPGYDKWDMAPFMEADMREWHDKDPVDDQERARNDEIYTNWQLNRNPFIDHPEWVSQITNF